MRYPEMKIDWRTHPSLADNIWHAQMAGRPNVLTYAGSDPSARRATRRAAMRFEHEGLRYEIPRAHSRDEYPFACTVEGGDVWVGHIPPHENDAQGGLISAFLKRHHIVADRGEFSRFMVTVINHPRGPVTATHIVRQV